jgi:hypothetical protein
MRRAVMSLLVEKSLDPDFLLPDKGPCFLPGSPWPTPILQALVGDDEAALVQE